MATRRKPARRKARKTNALAQIWRRLVARLTPRMQRLALIGAMGSIAAIAATLAFVVAQKVDSARPPAQASASAKPPQTKPASPLPPQQQQQQQQQAALPRLICPLQSGPSTILVWTLKEKENGQEARF